MKVTIIGTGYVTYVTDIVEGVYLSIENFNRVSGAEIFNIGCGSPIGLMDFIAEIELSLRHQNKVASVRGQHVDLTQNLGRQE